jgi:hypothetical protein
MRNLNNKVKVKVKIIIKKQFNWKNKLLLSIKYVNNSFFYNKNKQ